MRRFMMVTATVLGFLSFAGEIQGAKPSGGSILLSIEPVLMDSEGMHPQVDAASDLIPVSSGGSYHQLIQLGALREDRLLIVLSYRMTPAGLIALTLNRSIRSAGKEDRLPLIEKEISPLDSWRATLLEDTGKGGRLDLRVVPVLRRDVEDEPLDSAMLRMHLKGGPLVQYGETPDQDRVLFREVNIEGSTGLSFGIPGVGTIRLSTRRLKGADTCGWIRGHRLYFSMAGRDYSIWSTRMILPEDQDRPGKGWILFGELRPWSSSEEEQASYGGFSAVP